MLILQCAFQQSHLRGVQAGRSFFLQPTGNRYDLGDFFELWLGLFQSTVLGGCPYLNVDVSHKAFPKRYDNMAQLAREVGNDRALAEHLRGMDIVYNRPGNAGKKIHKFLDVDNTPERCMFELNGQRISVLQYFRQIGYTIQNPNLPCLRIGGQTNSITVPIELCSLSDAQVYFYCFS